MNTTYHEATRTQPYRAFTGNSPRYGLTNRLSPAFISCLGCSDIREEVLEELFQDFEDSVDIPDTIEESAVTDSVEELSEGDNTLEFIDQNESDYEEIVVQSLEQEPASSYHPVSPDHPASPNHPAK